MKVLHVLHHSLSILVDGYAVRSQNILESLQQHGLDVVAVTAPDSKIGLPDQEGQIRHWRCASFTSPVPLIRVRRRYSSLVKTLRQVVEIEQPDVIHAHSPFYNGCAALKVARERHIPCIYEMRAVWEDAAVDRRTISTRSLRYRFARAAESYVFKEADAIITICGGLRADLVSRGIPADKITIVPNAVPRETVRRVPPDERLKHQFGWPDGPVFGFIGSLFHYEGVDRILDAVPAVVDRIPTARFLVVGGGECETHVRQRVASQTNNAIVHQPRVNHVQVSQYYSIIDCLVYPRRKVRLTELVTPIKPLEAMAMAKAVIASDIGGHRELIEHRNTGWLFDGGTGSSELSDAMLTLAQSDTLIPQLGASGQAYVSSERTWDRVSLRYVDVYEKLLRKQMR